MSSKDEIQTIPEVLSFFGLDLPQEIRPAGFGIANHNFMVSTAHGDYVVKFLVNQTPESIENDIAIQRQLDEAGIGSARYLRHEDGDYLFRMDQLHAVVSPRLPGITPRHRSTGLAANIGRHLALFHRHVRSLPYKNHRGLMDPTNAVVDTEEARCVEQQPLPRGIIHGDLHAGNVIVDVLHEDRIVAVLDFEEAGENVYLIDLAVTLMAAGAPPEGSALESQLVCAVLQGYESVRPLSDQEHVWLPGAIAYAAEATINWFRANGYERYARQHESRYGSVAEALTDRSPHPK
jgi:homoserine kinase type II